MTSYAGIAQRERRASLPETPYRNRHPAPAFTDRVIAFENGRSDAIAGRRYRLTPKDLLERAGAPDIISYMLGYRAGELERKSGGAHALRTD